MYGISTAYRQNILLSDIQFHTEFPHSEDTVCVYVPEEKELLSYPNRVLVR